MASEITAQSEPRDEPLPVASVELLMQAMREYDYEYWGLRRETYLPADGAELPPSMNHETEQELEGTSTLDVEPNARSVERALRRAEVYMGDFLVLVGANRRNGGEDPGEELLVAPVVLVRMRAGAWAPGRPKR